MNSKQMFKFPMSKSERVIGILYIPFHILILPLIIAFVYTYMLQTIGVNLSEAYLNLVYYAFSFVFIFIFMHKFLKSSFSDLWDNVFGTIKTVILGYLFYYMMLYAISFAMTFFVTDLVNPNSEQIINEAKLNSNVMLVVSVFLAPIVEETLFRGALFGTLRKKSRIMAYIVSTVVFSAYHLWGYFLGAFDWTLFVYLLQYLPGAIILAWSYEKSGTIWAPIFLHMVINYLSITAQITA